MTGKLRLAASCARTLSRAGILAPRLSAIGRIGLRVNRSTLIAPPVFHGFGMIGLLLGLTLGSPIVLRRRFDPADVVAVIAEHEVATLCAVPVMLQRRLTRDAAELRSGTTTLRGVLSRHEHQVRGHSLAISRVDIPRSSHSRGALRLGGFRS